MDDGACDATTGLEAATRVKRAGKLTVTRKSVRGSPALPATLRNPCRRLAAIRHSRKTTIATRSRPQHFRGLPSSLNSRYFSIFRLFRIEREAKWLVEDFRVHVGRSNQAYDPLAFLDPGAARQFCICLAVPHSNWSKFGLRRSAS